MTALDRLIALHQGATPAGGARAAYEYAIELLESLDNLNSVAWQLLKAHDAADTLAQSPTYRAEYAAALDDARTLVLQTRIDDE